MTGRARVGLWVAGALLCATSIARAGTVTFDFNVEFSGGQAPSGPAPWIVATFTDISPGDVRLTISTSGLTGSEDIVAFYFNLNPSLDATKLAFSSDNGASGTTGFSSVMTTPTQSQMADGDGKYNVLLSYPPGGGFNRNMTSTYDITDSATTITAASFDYLSKPAGGHGPFFAAAHVQNTTGPGSGGSGWVAPVPAPLPAAVWLLLSGVGALGALARKRPAA